MDLAALAQYFQLPERTLHEAVADCLTTFELYQRLCLRQVNSASTAV